MRPTVIRRIDDIEVCGPHELRIRFSDGITKRVHVLPLLSGPIFQPLLDPEYFAGV